MSRQVHYDLIGTIPSMECFRHGLEPLMQRYEAGAPTQIPEFGLMSATDRTEYVSQVFKDLKSLQRMADGVAIELCAQHFYGLRGEDFDTVGELIDAIRGFDDELERK